MLLPNFKEFTKLARQATLVPIMKSVSADLLTPVSAFLSIAQGEPYAFMLESVEGGEKLGRYTFLGVRPFMQLRANGRRVEIRRGKKSERREANFIEVLRELFREHSPVQLPGAPPFTAGAVGFVAYDAVRQLEQLPKIAKNDVDVPDCAFMFFDRLLAFDHLKHQIHILASVDVRNANLEQAYEGALRDIDALERRLQSGFRRKPAANSKFQKLTFTAATAKQEFLHSAERAKEYIAAGDIFQVVLSQRLELKIKNNAFDIYRALRRLNPSPYMYFLRMGDMQVLGASPEMLVRVQGRKLSYRPIAGTRPRGADDAQDHRLEEELRSNEKERAEHVMLVDLGRNDVGRVSEYGSVKVRELMFVERYSHVMHLVSALEGCLRPELDALDAFAACFPAGTLTGAPKVRAIQIIEELEPVRRGVYGGSVLYADYAGNLDSCIAIRTMFMNKRRAYLQAGAGIVADSDPEMEYQEAQNKAKALLRAAEMAV
jgi:anthranilate synthase component 1